MRGCEKGIMLKQRRIPGIGLRIIKSGIAMALCFGVAYFRKGEGIVFYSLLSALWCMQGYRTNTRKNALQRFIGTVIGALYGLLFLLLIGKVEAIESGWAGNEEKMYILQAALVSVFIIIVLYTTVLFHKKQASYFSCVVFLSIAVNHAADAVPYLFVWNRFLDTCIGIGVGIFVNDFSLPFRKRKDVLFISGLDDTLLNTNSNLTDYAKVELNRMLEDGLQFTISTVRTPASLIESIQDIHVKLPVIAMDGAVLYDMEEKMYKRVYVISAATSESVLKLIRESGMDCFINIIVDDMLVIYYTESDNDIYNDVIRRMRKSPFRNYVKREAPKEEIVYIMLLDKKEKIEKLYHLLEEKGFVKELKIIRHPSNHYQGYDYMKIYNKNASKQNMMEYLKNMTGIYETITFGTISGQYDIIVHPGDSNKIIHMMKRYFEYGIKP